MKLRDTRKDVKVYCLIDPRSGVVRYVGATTTSIWKRVHKHYDKGSGLPRKSQWLEELSALGMEPNVSVLAIVPWYQGAQEERHWITVLKPDLNQTQEELTAQHRRMQSAPWRFYPAKRRGG